MVDLSKNRVPIFRRNRTKINKLFPSIDILSIQYIRLNFNEKEIVNQSEKYRSKQIFRVSKVLVGIVLRAHSHFVAIEAHTSHQNLLFKTFTTKENISWKVPFFHVSHTENSYVYVFAIFAYFLRFVRKRFFDLSFKKRLVEERTVFSPDKENLTSKFQHTLHVIFLSSVFFFNDY